MPSVGLMTRTLRYAFKAASVPATCDSIRRINIGGADRPWAGIARMSLALKIPVADNFPQAVV